MLTNPCTEELPLVLGPPSCELTLRRVCAVPQATCERGFAAMEESHQKVIDELQRKHQRELENLQEEKERLLAEETAATIAGKSQTTAAVMEMLGLELPSQTVTLSLV